MRRAAKPLRPTQVQAFYDRLGRFQDAQAIYEDRAVEDLLDHLVLDQAHSVLELGCGTGRVAARLLERKLSSTCCYRGVDISKTMISLARSRLAPWEDRASVDLIDATEGLNLADGSVDRLLATYVFDLLSEEHAGFVLTEALRVLEDGGRLGLVSLTQGETYFARVLTRLWQGVWNRKPFWMGGCRPVCLRAWLRPGEWRIEYHTTRTALGLLTSEIVVARPTGPS